MSIVLEDNIFNNSADNGGGGGGGGQTGEYFVKVIDYDGTVIDEQWLDDGAEYTLPSAPSHDGLVFQEWSSSETITNGKITIDKNNVMIGAIYTTASGQNEFDIELTKATGLTVNFKMSGTKDWGDGTSNTQTSHTYSDYGKYTIKTSSTTFSSMSYSSAFFSQGSSNHNYYCTAIRFATITAFTNSQDYIFSYCESLKYITFPKTITTLCSYMVEYCSALECIIIPNGITVIFGYFATQSRILKYIVIPNSVTDLRERCFYFLPNLEKLVLPKSITTFNSYVFSSCYSIKGTFCFNSITTGGNCFNGNSAINRVKFIGVDKISSGAFSGCYNIREYDFSNATAIPTLNNTDAFTGINKLCKIKVPASLYDDWIVAENWSTYADYIVAV